MKSDEIINLSPKNIENSKAKEFINKMYASYPKNPFNPREFAMVYDAENKEDDPYLAFFELTTSDKGPDWVEIKFIHTSPQKVGVGKRALQDLKDHAEKDGIKLELWTWNKSRVPVSKLRKFYSDVGFVSPTKRGPTTMTWEPTNESSIEKDDHENKDIKKDQTIVKPDTSATDEIFDKFSKAGYKLLGQGKDATVWLNHNDPGVVKIIMPSDGDGAGSGAETFHKFYKLCSSRRYSHLDNLPEFIKLKNFNIPSDLADKEYMMIGMEKLNKIPSGTFEEAIVWILSDLATKNITWKHAIRIIKNEKTWKHFDEGMNPKEVLNIINNWNKTDKIKYGVLFTLMRVLYQTGIINRRDWDLHTENVMMRNDGTLVIIDPWLDI